MFQIKCLKCNRVLTQNQDRCTGCSSGKPDVQVLPGSKIKKGASDEYTVASLLSNKGGTALTYLASSTLHGQVVIKQLRPDHHDANSDRDNNDRFEREFELLQKIDHPAFPKGYEFFELFGHKFLTEEFIDAKDLADLVHAHGAFGANDRTLTTLALAARALYVMHTQTAPDGTLRKWYHRDVKPDNIMLRSNGTVVLIDFGSARDTGSTKRRTVTITGTDGYMSVQYMQDQGDHTDDLYGLAAVGLFLVTGRDPKPLGADRDALLRMLPPTWQPVFGAAFNDSNVAGRPQGGDIFEQQLIGLMSPQGAQAYLDSLKVPTPTRAQQSRVRARQRNIIPASAPIAVPTSPPAPTQVAPSPAQPIGTNSVPPVTPPRPMPFRRPAPPIPVAAPAPPTPVVPPAQPLTPPPTFWEEVKGKWKKAYAKLGWILHLLALFGAFFGTMFGVGKQEPLIWVFCLGLVLFAVPLTGFLRPMRNGAAIVWAAIYLMVIAGRFFL